MSGKVVAITGAFGAVGQVVCQHMASPGVHVAMIDSAPAGFNAPPDANNLLVLGGVDLAEAAAAATAVESVIRRFQRLDVLINLAGAFRWERIDAGVPATWDYLHKVNVMTAVNMCRAAIPHLKASSFGRIVNVGANAALKADAGMGPYAASKAGVHRLTEALAEELKGTGICVNAVLPSIIDTPANRRDMPNANFEKWVTPVELAQVIAFLSSHQSSGITGALLSVVGRI